MKSQDDDRDTKHFISSFILTCQKHFPSSVKETVARKKAVIYFCTRIHMSHNSFVTLCNIFNISIII